MFTPADLREIKQRLSNRLMRIPGVSGVGLSAGRLTVYLERDAEPTRQEATALLRTEASGVPFDFVIAGVFKSG